MVLTSSVHKCTNGPTDWYRAWLEKNMMLPKYSFILELNYISVKISHGLGIEIMSNNPIIMYLPQMIFYDQIDTGHDKKNALLILPWHWCDTKLYFYHPPVFDILHFNSWPGSR